MHRFHRFVSLFAVSIVGTAAIAAQDGASQLRQLNSAVLRLHAEAETALAAQAASVRSQAAPLLRQRAAALEALIQQNPRQALSFAFSEDVVARLRAAFPQSAAALEERGEWSGTVERLIIDNDTLTSHQDRVLLESGDGTLEIHFAAPEPERLQSGDKLQAKGVRAGRTVAVESAAVEAAEAITCGPTGEQRIVVLMVVFPGQTPPSITAPQVADHFWGATGRTLDRYWREASYGKTWASGEVHGWITLDQQYTCDQTSLIRSAAMNAADSYVNFSNYNRIFILMPVTGCGWAGMAQVGCPTVTMPTDGTFQASTAWMGFNYFSTRDPAVKLASHEAGHNLGALHSRSRDFGEDVLGPLGDKGTLNEYGDVFSTMGAWNFGHYNAQHKLLLGWQDPAANMQTVQEPGTFSIQPTEKPGGLQAIKVRRGSGNDAWLWVEYRQPLGDYDSTLPSQVFTGALVHYQDLSTSSRGTDLIDFTPGTSAFSDSALASGRTWVDPYSNVSLTVGAPSGGALPVSVNYGTLPCVRETPAVTLSPANPSASAGSDVNYSVTVKNNDSAGCDPSTFALSSTAPNGWPSALSASALSLAPGASGTAALTKKVPEGTDPATYAVDTVASDAQRTAKGNANCTVTAPPPPLPVTVSAGAEFYSPRSSVPIRAAVLSGGDPAGGAIVTFTLTDPNGVKTTKSVKAALDGTALWNYRLGPKDGSGTYTVTAAAVFGSQTASGGPVTFVVQ